MIGINYNSQGRWIENNEEFEVAYMYSYRPSCANLSDLAIQMLGMRK